MFMEVIIDEGRLEVEAKVFVACNLDGEMEAEVMQWWVEGVPMPVSALGDYIHEELLDIAVDEWREYQN